MNNLLQIIKKKKGNNNKSASSNSSHKQHHHSSPVDDTASLSTSSTNDDEYDMEEMVTISMNEQSTSVKRGVLCSAPEKSFLWNIFCIKDTWWNNVEVNEAGEYVLDNKDGFFPVYDHEAFGLIIESLERKYNGWYFLPPRVPAGLRVVESDDGTNVTAFNILWDYFGLQDPVQAFEASTILKSVDRPEMDETLVDMVMDTILSTSSNQVEGAAGVEGEIPQIYFKAKLLYATEGELVPEEFHRNCDNQGPTLTIVESEGRVFGGYHSESWDSTSGTRFRNKEVNETTFLFSLFNATGWDPQVFKFMHPDFQYGLIMPFTDCLPSAGPNFYCTLCIGSQNIVDPFLPNVGPIPPNILRTNDHFVSDDGFLPRFLQAGDREFALPLDPNQPRQMQIPLLQRPERVPRDQNERDAYLNALEERRRERLQRETFSIGRIEVWKITCVEATADPASKIMSDYESDEEADVEESRSTKKRMRNKVDTSHHESDDEWWIINYAAST